MALLHNALIRGYKSIVVGYGGAWLRLVRAQRTTTTRPSFLGGLDALGSYLDCLADAPAWTPGAVVAMMGSMREPLEKHLHHEVAVMAAMATHRNAAARSSPAGAAAAAATLNADRTAEGGAWRDWRPMPRAVRWAVRWALVKVAGAVHGGRWRFASCDAREEPRELHALAADDGAGAEPVL